MKYTYYKYIYYNCVYFLFFYINKNKGYDNVYEVFNTYGFEIWCIGNSILTKYKLYEVRYAS